MPTFIYTAANNRGEILKGELETADTKTVVDYLVSEGLMAVSVKSKDNLGNRLSFTLFSSLSSQEKIVLTRHLARIIKAGLSLREGIDIILNDTENKVLKKFLTEAKFNLEKGQPLSVTLKKYPRFFSSVFVAVVEAGEVSGTLEKSLEYLGVELAKEYELERKIKGAMVYPVILIIASLAVIAILMVFVIPRLVKVFVQSNINLPWTTKVLIGLSDWTGKNSFAIVLFSVFGVIAFYHLQREETFRRAASALVLKVPLVGRLYKKMILARFTRTLGTLLGSGIEILRAVDISAEAIGANNYRAAVKNLKGEISRGVSVGNALKRGDLFPYLVVSMVNVGEKTGKLDSVLLELASFYEEEIDGDLKSLISLIEPVLLLFMGLVVAGIAFSVIMPIYQLVGSIK